MVNQEQMFTVMVIVGVIFSILTNVALYYYGEYRTLKKKLDDKESLHVKIEDFRHKSIDTNIYFQDTDVCKLIKEIARREEKLRRAENE